MRPRIEVQKGLAETEAGESAAARGGEQAGGIVTAKRNVEGEALVLRQRRPADAGIVQRAAMGGVDPQRFADGGAQFLKRIERRRPQTGLAATRAGDFAPGNARPARHRRLGDIGNC